MRALGLIVAALITLPAWAQQREASALIAAEGQRRIAVDAQRRLAEAEAKLHAQEPVK